MNNSLFPRLRVQILSAVLCVALVFFPARKSEALMPVVYSAMTAAGITITAADLAGLAIAVAGMGALTYMSITAPDGSTVAIPASGSSSVPPPVVTPPPVVPASVEWLGYTDNNYVQHWFTTKCAGAYALNALRNASFAANPDYYGRVTTETIVSCNENVSTYQVLVSDGFHADYYSTWGLSTTSRPVAASCPAGSTLVSGACVVDNPYVSANDGRQDIVRTGNSYSTVTGDQTGPTTANFSSTNTSSDTVTFNTSNNYAAPAATTVTANPNGGTTVTTYTQNTDNSGATYVTTTTINIDSTGTPTSTTTTNQTGGLGTDTNGLPVVIAAGSGAGGATVPIVIPANPTAGAGSDPIVFPNDYARQGETAAAVIPLVDALTASGVVADPVEPLAASMPSWGTTFDNLNDWELPPHASVCPRPDLDLSMVLGVGNVFTLDSHCDLMNDNGAALQAAMMVVWSMMAVFIVLRA